MVARSIEMKNNRLFVVILILGSLLWGACAEEIAVNTNFRKDLLPPGVSVTTPTNNQAVMPPFTLAGTVSDLGAVTNLTVYIQNQAGGPIYNFSTLPTNEAFSLTINLSNLATYSMWIEAIDDCGNSTNTATMTINVSADTLYVAPGGDDSGPGTATFPMATIQSAVERAAAVGISNVYVKAGSYTPGAGLNPAGSTSGLEMRADGIQLIGGWNDDYSAQTSKSILDGQWQLKHVIWAENAAYLKIDGFQVVHGKADGASPHNNGGGMSGRGLSYCTINNCTISTNSSTSYGGGLYLYTCINTICDVCLQSNTSMNGGGIASISGKNIEIVSIINHNNASSAGGGIFCKSANTTIKSEILSNSATKGGGIFCDVTDTYIFNCTISYNTVSKVGGGIQVERNCGNSIISNCLISNNSATYDGNAIWHHAMDCKIDNCTFSGSGASISILYLASAHYTSIKNNIFYAPSTGSYHAIREDVLDTRKHSIMNNQFENSPSLAAYYHDFPNGGTKNLANINNKDWSGANSASGNTEF